jgi:uncharacterized protein (TIGR02453 family)
MDSSFSGFPPEGIQFLADLAANNNREWFQANKNTYQEQLLKPAQRFVLALGERLQEISSTIRYDTATNGTGSLMRIYRDVRFSKDKTPYKTNISMSFWQGPGKKTAHPGFFIRFEVGGGGIFVGQHGFAGPVLAAYRDAVDDEKMGQELEDALALVKSRGDFEIGGAHFKRVPRGYDADQPRANLLKYNGLWALSSDAIVQPDLYEAELVDICFDNCKKMAPIHEWLVKLENRS